MAAYSLEFWRTSLPLCDLWRTLTPSQRAEALNIPPAYKAGGVIPAGLPEAAREAFLERDGEGRYRTRKEFARFQKMLLRALDWSRDTGFDLTRYLQEMTTTNQRVMLTGSVRGAAIEAVQEMEDRIRQGRYGKALAANPSAEAFLAELGGWQPAERTFDEAAHRSLRTWFQIKSAEEGPSKPLTTETFRLPGVDLPPEDILYFLLEYGVCLLSVFPHTLQPLISLPKGPRPKPVQGPENLVLRPFAGKESFARPFLLDDMAAYLRAVKAHPAPLLTDGVSVPIAHHRKVAKTLLPLPFDVDLPGWEGERRAEAAWWMLVEMELLREASRGRKGATAGAGPKAEAWLALPREQKLAAVLEKFPAGARFPHPLHRRFAFLGDFAAHPFPYAALDLDLVLGLDQAVERLDRPVDMGAWIHSAVEKANPLIAGLEADADLAWRWRRWDDTPQNVYGRLLGFHVARLCSVGALALWSDAEEHLGLSLTEVGGWLHGRAEAWTLPAVERTIAVVGGDFTVTLLEASLELEAELAVFAVPVSGMGGAGAAFKLTRASVQKAAHGGLTAERMAGILKAWSRHALPANVLHEIQAWSGARKAFKVREAVLVEGDDPLAVAELLASAPKDFERVSPTVLAYTGKVKPAALIQRLQKKGYLFS